MDDTENSGFSATNTKTVADEATPNKPLFATAGDISSNHNSIHKVNPVITANLDGKTDYNPMRSTPNRANDATDVTLVPESAAKLVDDKGERPTQAEQVASGIDMLGNSDKSKVPYDTIVTDPVTKIMTRVNDKTLADELADSDKAASA